MSQMRQVSIETVLDAADEIGVSIVGIGVKHGWLGNESFPWPKNSLFTPENCRIDGWPSAWALAESVGIYAGCGNTGQAQIRSDAKLPEGMWVRALDGWAQVV